MKAKLALVGVLVAVLALAGAGCGKVTGGGWFYDEQTENRVTIGATAQPGEFIEWYIPEELGIAEAKGQFQLVDHGTNTGTRTTIHGTFTRTYVGSMVDAFDDSDEEGYIAVYWGICSVNGEEDVPFWAEFYCEYVDPDTLEGPIDYVYISIGTDEYGIPGDIVYCGEIQGGNMMVHKNNGE